MACFPVPKVGGAAAPSAPPVPTPMHSSLLISYNKKHIVQVQPIILNQLKRRLIVAAMRSHGTVQCTKVTVIVHVLQCVYCMYIVYKLSV